ncbi:hypothetical protein FHETE_3636 [Fusarium heterosporum]|uniref:Uncharacterized protein n=1 Tax=Fusarium heterosporum TaxID=42747 RepID=A0A8H5TQS7_FUSHE|nr:hypothetical protein FHETE_3636 [Fusarium heterosporum]
MGCASSKPSRSERKADMAQARANVAEMARIAEFIKEDSPTVKVPVRGRRDLTRSEKAEMYSVGPEGSVTFRKGGPRKDQASQSYREEMKERRRNGRH